MLQYLIILLDDASTSYCHYECTKKEHRLISLKDLKDGVFFAMKENLMIQFVYPDYSLPSEYEDVIDSIDHSKIMPASYCIDADVTVFNSWQETIGFSFKKDTAYVIRICKEDLFSQSAIVSSIIGKVARLNVVITDIETFSDVDFDRYKDLLAIFSTELKQLYANGISPQLNILTDRLILDKMNSCNAGCENITLAPDGKFYVCPAFYYAGICDGKEISLSDVCQKGYSVGSLKDGLDIKNPQLYKLNYAPLCRHCDAYQCKRCIWLNRKTTLEVNTPSREQCVLAHLERNASRQLLADIRKLGEFLPEKEIKEIDYLDPFDVRKEW